MKRVLPPNEKIAKDAKEAVQECVSEFICFVTQVMGSENAGHFVFLFFLGLRRRIGVRRRNGRQ